MHNLSPMTAVTALYATDGPELAEAIVASLSQAIFHDDETRPACKKKIFLGRVSQKVVRWTTRSMKSIDEAGGEVMHFRNRLMERSGHPYAQALLTSSETRSAALVEGGDPMNGPYMMLSPEIRKNGGVWDRIFLDSVQAKDVQVRFIHETRATYQAARRLLDCGQAVRIKAVAAGTGLSLILVYDKLVRDGYDPKSITAVITDRDRANSEKSNRLLAKLSSTRNTHNLPGQGYGILAVPEDVFEGPDPAMDALHVPYNIVTAIGILEYFQGGSHTTTEQRLMLHEPEEAVSAGDLAAKLGEMTTLGGNLIVNTYRDHASIRILELFGKRFDFRDRVHLHDLFAPLNFRSFHLAGSGHIYDVEVFEKI
ncbi:MAG: hypothetical protein V4640_11105 [Verrucomicrobiota bacterium]